MGKGIEFDEQDQRFVRVIYDERGNPAQTVDDKGRVAIGEDESTRLWLVNMWEVLKFNIQPRNWKFLRKRKPKTIG